MAGFEKGKSGNPGGRPKAQHRITELARQHCLEAIKTLAEIAKHGKTEAARVSASQHILDRGYGKPPQFSTGDAAHFRRAVEMSDDELATIASEAARSGNGASAPQGDTPKPH